jgi:hypothetical protein
VQRLVDFAAETIRVAAPEARVARGTGARCSAIRPRSL